MSLPVTEHVFTTLDGETLKTLNIKNVVRCHGIPGAAEAIEHLPSFKAREDDIWVNAFPKSGTHWTWEIVYMLMHRKAEHNPEPKENAFLEMTGLKHFEDAPSPRVLNSHLPVQCFPEEIFKKGKIIYIIRNPKDAAVSHYHHFFGIRFLNYNGKWDGFFPWMMKDLSSEGKYDYCNWFSVVLPWWEKSKKCSNILVLKYEDMIKDLPKEVAKIASFIGYENSTEFYEDVARQCNFQVMQALKRSSFESHANTSDGKPKWKDSHSHGMYRKGKVGNWKNHFTVAQNEEFDAMFTQRMKYTDLTVEFEI